MKIREEEKIGIRNSYGKYLAQLQNDKIVVLDSDLSSATKTDEFAKKNPTRHFNLGICEQNMIGIAAGLAQNDLIPIANTFAVFAMGRAYDQIRNSICYPNQNVKIVGTHYGLTVGQDGASHQMLEDIALSYTLPNMSIYCPSDDLSCKIVLEQAVQNLGPTYIRISRLDVPRLYEECDITQIQKGYFEYGKGNEGLIITTGDVSHLAYLAQKELEKENIYVKVIDIFKLKPLNIEEILPSIRNAKKVLVVENHNVNTGLASIIQNVLNDNFILKHLYKIGVNDQFGQSGKPYELLENCGISVENIKKYFYDK